MSHLGCSRDAPDSPLFVTDLPNGAMYALDHHVNGEQRAHELMHLQSADVGDVPGGSVHCTKVPATAPWGTECSSSPGQADRIIQLQVQERMRALLPVAMTVETVICAVGVV